VLLVEDDPDAQRAMRLMLRKKGFEVEAASTIKEGFLKLDTFQPSNLVLDLMLPDGNGSDLLYFIRQKGLDVNVAVVSATGDQVMLNRVMDLKPEHYFPKPLDVSKLIAVLK
jgi:DNA-binding response OmpR family regulator